MLIQPHSPANADRGYLFWFFALFIPFCLAVLVFKRTDLFPWVGSCDHQGYDSEHYLAYCHNNRFGDYEHYAFWHDTESEQIQNLKDADVVFLGNSRTQFAFSTQAVKDYFRDKGLSYFVLGFGLGGKSDIPLSLFQKYDLQPKAVVINADPFFASAPDQTLVRAKANSKSTAWEHQAKIYLQNKQKQVCHGDKLNSVSAYFFCRGNVETLFRSRENGYWLTDFYRPDNSVPISYDASLLPLLEESVELAEDFMQKTGLTTECTIVTVTPRTGTPLAFAKALAQRAGLAGYFPDLENLSTVDESHLNKSSAERWSEAVLTMASDDIQRCASGAQD